MSFIDAWEQVGVPTIETFLGLERARSVDAAIKSLYNEADKLAVTTVQFIIATIWWAFHMSDAAANAKAYSTQILDAANRASILEQETWSEFLLHKYPADLQALYRQVQSDIGAQGNRARARESAGLAKLAKEIAALELWKRQTVTPDLNKCNRFYRTFTTHYEPPLKTLRRWLASPSTFAAWALPPLISSLPSALQAKNSRKSARLIEQALLATWANDPQQVWTLVQAWLVSE